MDPNLSPGCSHPIGTTDKGHQSHHLGLVWHATSLRLRGKALSDPDFEIRTQQNCFYQTVALGFSEFCDLFTQEEWEGYEYANGVY